MATHEYPEPILASVIGMALGAPAGVALAPTGLGAPVVVVGLVLGLAIGSSIDAARARRRRGRGAPPARAPRSTASAPVAPAR